MKVWVPDRDNGYSLGSLQYRVNRGWNVITEMGQEVILFDWFAIHNFEDGGSRARRFSMVRLS